MQRHFCPKCYGKRYVTVPLKQAEEDWVCTADSSHVFSIDKEGYPRSKK